MAPLKLRRRHGAAGLPGLLLLFAGCVPLPQAQVPRPAPMAARQGMFQGLDPGAKSDATLHFDVRAYDSVRARQLGALAETLYNRIVADTGLFSFTPERPFPIILYRTPEEFFSKTGLPADLVSGAVDASGCLYLYEGAFLPDVVAHEVTHLIFREYMGALEPVWLNEGLAVYEEQESSREPVSFFSGGRPIDFDEMTRLDGIKLAGLSPEQGFRMAGLDRRGGAMGAWYHQVGSVVRFLIEKGGRTGFAAFLRAVRAGRGLDEALSSSFPGRWRDLRSLEREWRGGR